MDIKRNILVVDDEKKIVDVVKSYLEVAGYAVYVAYNGSEALKIFDNIEMDLIILDLMLPDMSGEQICKEIRAISKVPIIMLTAKVSDDDVINGLNIGADDYITKPFSPRQIEARVNAVLRRSQDRLNILEFNEGKLKIDRDKYEIIKNNNILQVTKSEFSILCALAGSPNKTFTREELISIAFGYDYDGMDRTIDTYIKNLRAKIEEDTKKPEYIITVHGVGYRFGYK